MKKVITFHANNTKIIYYVGIKPSEHGYFKKYDTEMENDGVFILPSFNSSKTYYYKNMEAIKKGMTKEAYKKHIIRPNIKKISD